MFLSWRYTPKCPSPRLSNIVDRKGQLYLPEPSHLTHNNGPLDIFRCLHNYSVVGTRRSGCLWVVAERCRKVALTGFCCSQFPHGFLSVLFSSGAVKSSHWLWDQSADLILTCQKFFNQSIFADSQIDVAGTKIYLNSLSRKTWRNIDSVKFESKRLWWTSKQKEEILSLGSTQNNYL